MPPSGSIEMLIISGDSFGCSWKVFLRRFKPPVKSTRFKGSRRLTMSDRQVPLDRAVGRDVRQAAVQDERAVMTGCADGAAGGGERRLPPLHVHVLQHFILLLGVAQGDGVVDEQ